MSPASLWSVLLAALMSVSVASFSLRSTQLGLPHARHRSPTHTCCTGHRNRIPLSHFARLFSSTYKCESRNLVLKFWRTN